MKTNRWLLLSAIFLVSILAITPLLAACGPKAQPSQVLKIGMMTPSTGPVPEKGLPGQHGIQDAIEYINTELGGAGGYPIEVLWRDSAYDMAKVGTIVQNYMNEGAILFTTHSSSEMKAAQGKANDAGFPGLATFISTMNLHPPQHIYGPTPDYGDDWVAFARYYKENVWKGTGKPKMAMHLLSGTVGQGTLDGAQAMADEIGIELVDVQNHLINTTDETASLTVIKSKNPDVLFISSVPAPTAVIIKNAKDLGMYPGITIGAASASFTKALVDLAGADVVEGVYGVFHTVSWDDDVPGVAKAKEYVMKNHPEDYGNMDYFSTWSTTLIIREILELAVKNVGYDVLAKGDAAAWKAVEEQGIQKLKGYTVEGLQGGTVTYTPGDNRLNKFLRIYQIQDGKIVALGDWQEAPLIKYAAYGDQ
ncbi:MAG: ABC transporter substrate-binding protein [Dehalococcoidia bacterium]|jgi:branched-chain amino acid transport system substrate-binding protein|nr:MAG: ABC transporter substrate-binding protein [Dehalococcoidia bacterium]